MVAAVNRHALPQTNGAGAGTPSVWFENTAVPVVIAITFQALFVMVATRKHAFVIVITAKVRRSGYTTSWVMAEKG